jgi:hypothetical protein
MMEYVSSKKNDGIGFFLKGILLWEERESSLRKATQTNYSQTWLARRRESPLSIRPIPRRGPLPSPYFSAAKQPISTNVTVIN